ncbi:MAG: hypothetical protein CMJ83_19905 [Planctomycetes bacterium]|nr:hypothetical protein [Planctomycetota bacterium]
MNIRLETPSRPATRPTSSGRYRTLVVALALLPLITDVIPAQAPPTCGLWRLTVTDLSPKQRRLLLPPASRGRRRWVHQAVVFGRPRSRMTIEDRIDGTAYIPDRGNDPQHLTLAGSAVIRLHLINAAANTRAFVAGWSAPRIVATGNCYNAAAYEARAMMEARFKHCTGANNRLQASETGSAEGFGFRLEVRPGFQVGMGTGPSIGVNLTWNSPVTQDNRPAGRVHETSYEDDYEETPEERLTLRGRVSTSGNADGNQTDPARCRIEFSLARFNAGLAYAAYCPPTAAPPIPEPDPPGIPVGGETLGGANSPVAPTETSPGGTPSRTKTYEVGGSGRIRFNDKMRWAPLKLDPPPTGGNR